MIHTSYISLNLVCMEFHANSAMRPRTEWNPYEDQSKWCKTCIFHGYDFSLLYQRCDIVSSLYLEAIILLTGEGWRFCGSVKWFEYGMLQSCVMLAKGELQPNLLSLHLKKKLAQRRGMRRRQSSSSMITLPRLGSSKSRPMGIAIGL